jgi:hypothetical protein
MFRIEVLWWILPNPGLSGASTQKVLKAEYPSLWTIPDWLLMEKLCNNAYISLEKKARNIPMASITAPHKVAFSLSGQTTASGVSEDGGH